MSHLFWKINVLAEISKFQKHRLKEVKSMEENEGHVSKLNPNYRHIEI